DSINTATAFAYQDGLRSAQDLLALARRGEVDEAAVERHVLQLTLPQLIRHVQILVESLKRAETKAYVKIGTSGTGGMGFNIPYTHSEERPSRPLLMKSAVAGAQTLLLFLLGRTPGAPATIEIKPTATIAWREIGFGPIRRKGKPIPLVDCPEPVPVSEAFRPGAQPWCDLGKPLEGVYIDVGENGLFSSDEFETVSALGQMEFITPEEVAEYAVLELEGRPVARPILSVGLAILTPDGGRLYRGSTVAVPGGGGGRAGADPRDAAPRGWVDLRPEQFGMWIARAREMLAQAERRRRRAADSGSDVDWTALGADDPIEPARFATWVFRYEDRGERIKR